MSLLNRVVKSFEFGTEFCYKTQMSQWLKLVKTQWNSADILNITDAKKQEKHYAMNNPVLFNTQNSNIYNGFSVVTLTVTMQL